MVIYEGVHIGDDCVLEDMVRVGYGTEIGARARLAYAAFACDRVTIGSDARAARFICDGARIGARSSVMGDLLHEYRALTRTGGR